MIQNANDKIEDVVNSAYGATFRLPYGTGKRHLSRRVSGLVYTQPIIEECVGFDVEPRGRRVVQSKTVTAFGFFEFNTRRIGSGLEPF